MKKSYTVGFILLLLAVSLSAQEVVSTVGESYQNSTVQVAFTAGQLSIEVYSKGSIIVAQGFHQTFEEIITGLESASNPIDLYLFWVVWIGLATL